MDIDAQDAVCAFVRDIISARTDEQIDISGLKKVCVEFRQVLLNGTLVRDWPQQPRVE